MIKKLLAVLMAVSMIAAILPVSVMAEGYYDDSDMVGVESIVATETYEMSYATYSTVTADSLSMIPSASLSNDPVANTQRAVVYKVPLPVIPQGKILATAEFRATSTSGSTSARPLDHAYKLPDDLAIGTLTVGQAASYINASAFGTGSYYIGGYIADASCANGKLYRNRYDVKSYINECIANEQEYFYIALTRESYTVRASMHSVSTSYWQPKLFYTLSDVSDLTYDGCSLDGRNDVYPIGSAKFEFSNVLQSATATINGVEVAQSKITIAGSSVSVDYGDLGLSANCTISVTATDTYSQTVSATISFTTAAKYDYWNDSDLPAGIASVQAEETYELSYATYTNVTNESNAIKNYATELTDYPVAAAQRAVLYKVMMPEVPEGKVFDIAQFRASSYWTNTSSRAMQYAYILPNNIDIENMTVAQAAEYISAPNDVNSPYYIGKHEVSEDPSYAQPGTYRNRYDIAEKLNECVANGDEYFYIALTRDGTAVRAYPHGASGNTYLQPRLFYTLVDAPVISVPKIVNSSADGEYDSLADIDSFTGITGVKAATYMKNTTSDDISLMVGIAQYYDTELVAVSFVPYILAAGTSGETVFFGASDLQTDVDSVKAFIWYSDYAPVAVKSFSTQS